MFSSSWLYIAVECSLFECMNRIPHEYILRPLEITISDDLPCKLSFTLRRTITLVYFNIKLVYFICKCHFHYPREKKLLIKNTIMFTCGVACVRLNHD